MTPPRLRPYQIADRRKIDAAFAAGKQRVLHQSPTGSGKTVEFTELIGREADDGARVLVLGHRDEIVQQVSGALRMLGIRYGVRRQHS
jgi:DNA repair protein RadD